MKKVIIASVPLLLAAVLNVNASASSTYSNVITNTQQDTTEKRTPVIPDQLPEPVKQTLAGNDYKGWTPSSAFLVAKGTKEHYEIKLVKEGSDPNTIKLDKDGKKVD